jgi:hypothetical protein
MSQRLEKVFAVKIEIFDAAESSLALVNDDNHDRMSFLIPEQHQVIRGALLDRKTTPKNVPNDSPWALIFAFCTNSVRRRVIMFVHETAIAWFTHDLDGPFCGRRFSWQSKITYDPLQRPRPSQKVRCSGSWKCSSRALIGIMTASWTPTNWRHLSRPFRGLRLISGSIFRAGQAI